LQRPSLRLTLDCNNACAFCAQKGLEGAGVSAFEEQLEALRARADEVTFTGGEPTLVPDLPTIIATARGLGFRAIGLQTNGRRLKDGPFLRDLVEAGLTDVHLSIHGSEPAVHDYHTGTPGSFAEVVAALKELRSNSVSTVVTTVLTRSNYRVLGGLPRLLKSTGVVGWTVSIPRVAGTLGRRDDRLTPRLGLAMPFVLAALTDAGKLGLESWITGAPACTLGPFAARLLPEAPRAYAKVCESCPAKRFCPGVDPIYLERFHGDELGLREFPAPGKHAAVTRLFVGVGEIAPPAADPAPAANVPLTQLGTR
jgi:sulfatase maturation enzyme AslB (radical SAM superfamily)